MGVVEDRFKPASAPGVRGPYIVMVCADMSEAEAVGRSLSELNTGCLVSYCRAADVAVSPPAGEVALFVLATNEGPETIRLMLEWLRRYWPRSPVAVVGDAGCGRHEMVARAGAAAYLIRPVPPHQWRALLQHAIERMRSVAAAREG